MTVVTGMVGHGEYNRHSATQLASIEHVMPWLVEAIGDLPLDGGPETIALADFGCSEGRNSIAAMNRLIGALRRRTSRPILTVHSDLPTNDYSELMTSLRPEGRSVFDDDNVFSAAVGGSMFDQLLPPRSLYAAATFNAIGFLSERPVERLAGYVVANGPSARNGVGHVSDEDRRKFADQAHADVERFLAVRAAELVAGGKLLIEVFGSGETLRTCDGMFDALNDALLESLEAGLIDRDGYERYYQPVYFRTLEELIAPLSDPRSECSGLFRLDRTETYEVPVPFVEAYRRDHDGARFARDYTDFFRVFTEPVLRMTLAAHPKVDDAITEIFSRAERLIRDDPDRYELHFMAIAALMTRRAD